MERAAYCFVLSVSLIVLLSLFRISFSDPQEIILIVVYKAFMFKNKRQFNLRVQLFLKRHNKGEGFILYHIISQSEVKLTICSRKQKFLDLL